MITPPLLGWGMLSAAHYPMVMFSSLHLPPILPPHPTFPTVLRKVHTLLSYLLFAPILAHLGAVLFTP